MLQPPLPNGVDGIVVEGDVATLRPSRAQNLGVARIALVGYVAVGLLFSLLAGPVALVPVTIAFGLALVISQRTVSVQLTPDGVLQKQFFRTVRTSWVDVTGADVVTSGKLRQVRLLAKGGEPVILAVPTQTAVANDPGFEARAAYVLAWQRAVARR